MADVHAVLRCDLRSIATAISLAGSHDRMVAQEPGRVQAGQGRKPATPVVQQREPRRGCGGPAPARLSVMALCLPRLGAKTREVRIVLTVQ
jgi:hypothetical protein